MSPTSDDDTIAAIATASGAGGVGIVRLSGPAAISIVRTMIGGRELPERRMVHAIARDGDGRIDEVLAVAMPGPRSFTGEDVAELHGHGGTYNLGRLLRAVIAAGARVADPGEFTRRAFEHGRLDLARAEALLAVIEAGSERAWRQAQVQLDGALGAAVRELRAGVTRVLAELEGAIDFPDDDLELRGQAWVRDELAATSARARELTASYQRGRMTSSGIEVALVGAVNVGKSSLLNALIGRERALVADQPGTTRDYVEASCEWNGYAVTLIDTAGERDAGDDVERRGIELGRRRSDAADVVVVINDGVAARDDGVRFGKRALMIRSKADLGGERGTGELMTSTVTGEGLDALREKVLERAGIAETEGATGALVTTERQRAALVEAADKLAAAAKALSGSTPLEMVVLDIRHGDAALGQVLGEAVDEHVLDALFARFCIGK